MLGAQIATALFQFGYAGVTSRLVPDTGFGAVAAAMSLLAVVTLIAQGGLGEATARTPELHRGKLSFLVLVAIGLGVAAGLLLVLLAKPWALLWDAPDAVGPARLIGVAAFLAPLSGLLLGVQWRLGRFRALAVSMVATSAAGMAIGVVAVILAPGPMTLLVSPVAASVFLAIVLLFLTRRHWWARPDAVAARADLGFAWRILGITILAYLSLNAGKWSVSRWVGTDALGQWNRADVLTAVPIDQATRAITRAVYPELRHDIGVQSRTRQAWTDYLLLVAWAAFPLAAILAGVAPSATAILFGPGWGLAAAIAPLVAIQYGLFAVESVLANALESVGQFRLRVWTALASVAVIAAGAAVTKVTGSWAVALAALIAASLLQHLLQVVFTARLGALDGWSLAKGYSCSLAASAVLGGAAALLSAGMLGRMGPLAAIAGAVILIAVAVLGVALRRHLPPVKILARYREGEVTPEP
ncbi:oligosaccharide flippase family protein [Mycobacterium sp. OAE908]|uniref:oligosaccharide flippase family protein n=1 Tax=Mycobacterium sp. OAE908 TaxID=2817899 RepID=UPI001AE32DBD